MKAALIVYYSRSGVTATVARALAELCGGELEALRPARPMDGVGGYWRAAWQALRAVPAEIDSSSKRPADFPLLLLGTPVWASHMSSPMRAYILRERERLPDIGLFCTMGGSGGARVLHEVAELCGKAPRATLCLRESEVRAGRHLGAVRDFAASVLGQSVPAPASTADGRSAAAEQIRAGQSGMSGSTS